MNKIEYVNDIYLCYLCSSRIDKNGYVLLNLNGLVNCGVCKKEYPLYKLIVKKDDSIILTYSGPRQLTS
jgi:hypothetical protein